MKSHCKTLIGAIQPYSLLREPQLQCMCVRVHVHVYTRVCIQTSMCIKFLWHIMCEWLIIKPLAN